MNDDELTRTAHHTVVKLGNWLGCDAMKLCKWTTNACIGQFERGMENTVIFGISFAFALLRGKGAFCTNRYTITHQTSINRQLFFLTLN